MQMEHLSQYELLQHECIEDIQSEGYLLRHKKSGARVLVLENEDENKVFGIAFRTVPTDNTGVAHILEHSVLCGSRKFPSKDPFVELVKGSLNTFLNAMTYPDKTIYPIASCNNKDFCNLMHVYLDAVFYPNIYQKEEIFRQEGWNYQLESPGDELIYNGVVYNEMKGVYSDPEEVLGREIMNSLYPDNTYGVESGGDPEHIPDLTYEQFLDFHRKFYHPSNSYIYLYGAVDFEERLRFMDEEYLSHFDACPVDSEIALQKPFEATREIFRTYPVSEEEEEDAASATYLSYNAVYGTSLDSELTNAFAVLDYALLSAPGAVLKQALLDAGIGDDILSSNESGIYQPYFSVIAKNASAQEKERFLQVIRETLEKVVREGLDRKTLLAGINAMEFRFREADYGSYPKGLMYGLDIFDSWLYDETAPFTYLKQLDVYARLKEAVKTDYYENLIRTYLLDNPHSSVLVLTPEPGLTTRRDEQTKAKLAAYRASLSEAQVQELVRRTEKLRRFQETPSTAEELEKIPLLTRGDIERKTPEVSNRLEHWGKIPVLCHDIFTTGIAYMDLLFDASGVSLEEVSWLGLLKAVLGMMDTQQYRYQELNNEINLHTGGVTVGLSVFPAPEHPEELQIFAGVRIRTLYGEIPFALEIAKEMLLHTILSDKKRLHEILAKLRSRISMSLAASGHTTAACRAMACISPVSAFNERVGGITFYRLAEDLEAHFEEKADFIQEKLQTLIRKLFTRDQLLVSITCDEKGQAQAKAALEAFVQGLPFGVSPRQEKQLLLPRKREGFMTPGQVQYVARGGSFAKAGYPYTAVLKIAKVLMGYDYLWNNVRVKGGAYGCMNSSNRLGECCFVSYRDPNLAKTNEVYEHVPDYLEHFDADEREMTKYIIGTISELDTPLTPSQKGSRALSMYMSGLTTGLLQKERDEIMNAEPEQIRALAPLMRAVLENSSFCVIGNEEKIKENRDLFDEIQMLTH